MNGRRPGEQAANFEVELRHTDFACVVRPALGGSVWKFSRAGVPVLRDQSECRSRRVTDSACFPLVPFSNRLRDRSFVYEDRTYHLPANVPGTDRVAHGFGWREVWWIVRQDAISVTLRHQHAAKSGWPWSYEADQHIALGPNGLTIGLSVTNRALSPMPAGLGLHPYFPRLGDEQLELMPGHVFAPGLDGFPSDEDRSLKTGWSVAGAGAKPTTAYIDGWHRPAVIRRSGAARVDLNASANARHLILYAPDGVDYFCVEPVTHAVGALNEPSMPGIVVLGPGATERMTMTISPAL